MDFAFLRKRAHAGSRKGVDEASSGHPLAIPMRRRIDGRHSPHTEHLVQVPSVAHATADTPLRKTYQLRLFRGVNRLLNDGHRLRGSFSWWRAGAATRMGGPDAKVFDRTLGASVRHPDGLVNRP
jgi:hypothetical protein